MTMVVYFAGENGLQSYREVYRATNEEHFAKEQLISLAIHNLHVTGGSDSHGTRPLGGFYQDLPIIALG